MPNPDRSVSDRAVFRLPWSALAFPVLIFLITTPLATALPILNLLFLLPILALIYVLWTRTVVDGHNLTVYTLRGRRRLPWAELNGLEFHGPRWAIAVTLSGAKFRLPMIRPRDLPRLVAVSGGRLIFDTPATAAAEFDGADLDDAQANPVDQAAGQPLPSDTTDAQSPVHQGDRPHPSS